MATTLPNQFTVGTPAYSLGKDPGMHTAARQWALVDVVNGSTSDAYIRAGTSAQVDHIGTRGAIGIGGSGWTLGTNWSVVAGKLHHATGNTATASANLLSTIVGGTPVLVTFEVSGFVSGTVSLRVGTSTTVRGGDGTYSEGITAVGDATQVLVTPSSTFVGDVDNIGIWTNASHDTALGYYDYRVPAGGTVEVTQKSRIPVTHVSVYVPASGTLGAVIVIGKNARSS